MFTREDAIKDLGEAKVERYEQTIKRLHGWETAQIYEKVAAAAEILEVHPASVLFLIAVIAVHPGDGS